MTLQLVMFSTDSEAISRLRSALAADCVEFAVGRAGDVTGQCQLDAIFLSWMAANEILGADPPFPDFQARVLPMPDGRIAAGLPKLAVAGVAVPRDYVGSPIDRLRLTLSAVHAAVAEFNRLCRPNAIKKLGVVAESLRLDRVSSADAREALHDFCSGRLK